MKSEKEKNFNWIKQKYKQDFCTFSDVNQDKLPLISSGSICFDIILGGGYPKGSIAEIWGDFSTGKTTECLHIIKSAQEQFPKEGTAFIDTEHTLYLPYAQSIGVNLNKMMLFQPSNGDVAFDIIEDLIRSRDFSVVILDSVASLVPKSSLEEGKVKPGEIASLLSRRINVLKNLVKETRTFIMFTNQIRLLQIQPFALSGPTGGNALKFFASIRIELKKKSFIKDGENKIGQLVRATTLKNKFSMPQRVCEFIINYDGKGISLKDEVLQLGASKNLIKKSGGWYEFNEQKFHGRDEIINYFNNNNKIFKELLNKVK